MSTIPATRKLTRLQYAATILGALAVTALAPATANATDNQPAGPDGGCHYTDADGYDVPIDDGQDVFVDGKIVSCRGGSIIITTAPKTNVGTVRPQLDPNLGVLIETPQTRPVLHDVPVSKTP